MRRRRHPRPSSLSPRVYREVRSARFPLGLPDRTDQTVDEAFNDAWLLVQHDHDGARVVGLAEDYEAARAWLDEDPGE
ncbi:hypothetical protein [Blastococcus sp. SYSU D00695]